MQNYDYIITGSGASGLMLAYRMAKDSFFDNASILIIDKEKKTSNDRTWCFWENGEGEWDELLHKSWDKILFESNIYKNTIPLQSYAYKMLRSGVFYDKLWNFIETKNNISFIKANVTSILDTAEGAFVETSIGQYRAVKLLNSVDFDQKYTRQEEYPVLLQHFTGWFVETKKIILMIRLLLLWILLSIKKGILGLCMFYQFHPTKHCLNIPCSQKKY